MLEGTPPTEKVRAAVIDALKAAMTAPGESLLIRSGKLPGLFATRTGIAGEAAQWAIANHLFDVLRREERGKIVHEFVRLAPAGLEFLHSNESPRAVLAEMRDAIAVTRAGVPVWLDDLRKELANVAERLANEVAEMNRRLDALGQRIDAALLRADAAGPSWPEGATATAPWALAALAYLDKRRATSPASECPLPELFAAAQRRYDELTLAEFHDGLRRLADNKALRLSPFSGPATNIPEPEYALPNGAEYLYFAAR